MSHAYKLCSEKLFAKLLDISISTLSKEKTVPKKVKTAKKENGDGPLASSVQPKTESIARKVRRSTSAKKNGRKQSAPKTKASPHAPSTPFVSPSDEEIRIRAYFIAERREKFALLGDPGSDWLEATRELLSESGPR